MHGLPTPLIAARWSGYLNRFGSRRESSSHSSAAAATSSGTGRMPGFSKMLTPEYIKRIVSYERYCLNTSTFLRVEPLCVTGTAPREAATTTTAAASAKG